MTTVFADTFYFLGILNRADEAHERCKRFAMQFRGRLLTTDYVIVELADGLSSPNHRVRAARFIHELRGSSTISVIPSSDSVLSKSLDLFASRTDKDWSLTDCTSFTIMRDHGLTAAATGDRHFEQAGYEALLLH